MSPQTNRIIERQRATELDSHTAKRSLDAWLSKNFIHGELSRPRAEPRPIELPDLAQFNDKGAGI